MYITRRLYTLCVYRSIRDFLCSIKKVSKLFLIGSVQWKKSNTTSSVRLIFLVFPLCNYIFFMWLYFMFSVKCLLQVIMLWMNALCEILMHELWWIKIFLYYTSAFYFNLNCCCILVRIWKHHVKMKSQMTVIVDYLIFR